MPASGSPNQSSHPGGTSGPAVPQMGLVLP